MSATPTDSHPFDDLPDDDLAALAQQLSADAAFLAERYPAPAPADAWVALPPAVPQKRWRRPLWMALAASLLAMAATATWRDWPFGARPPAERPAPPAQRAVAVRAHEPLPPTGDAIESLPTVSFDRLSGPEQEAVLDLLEDNDLASNRLSI